MGAPSKLIVDDICRAIFDLRAEIVVVGIVKTKASCVMPKGPEGERRVALVTSVAQAAQHAS
jgi:hypothetical protein